MDDKHKLKVHVGKPVYLVATVERRKPVNVTMGKRFEDVLPMC
jgi:hypothetical protein